MPIIKRTYLVTKEIQGVVPKEVCQAAWDQSNNPKNPFDEPDEKNPCLSDLIKKNEHLLGTYMFCGNCKEFGKAIEHKVNKIPACEHVAYQTTSTTTAITTTTSNVGEWIALNENNNAPGIGTLKMSATASFNGTSVNSFNYIRSEESIDACECPHCGYKIKAYGPYRGMDEKAIWLNYKQATSEIIWQDFFEEGENNIIIKTIVQYITPFNDKLQIRTTHYRSVINVKTGFTYDLPPHVNHAPITSKRKNYPSVKNITNIAMPYWNEYGKDVLQGVAELLQRKKTELFGYNVKSIQEQAVEFKEMDKVRSQAKRAYLKTKQGQNKRIIIPSVDTCYEEKQYLIKFADILHYNRMPNLNFKQYSALLHISRSNNGRVYKAIASVKADNPDPVGQLLRNMKLPVNKTYRNIIRLSPKSIFSLESAHKSYKEIGNVKKLFDFQILDNLSASETHSREKSIKKDKTKRFIAIMMEEFGETIWVNKMAEHGASDYYLNDTAKMYFKIKARKSDLTLDIRGSVMEMHDRFADIVNKLEEENMPLEYEDKFLKLDETIDGFEFYLAKETDELKIVGNLLKICVGGYRERALEKELIIALVKKDGHHRICIELSTDCRTLHQAKIHCNKFPSGELLKALTTWMDKHKIVSNNGNDVPTDAFRLEERMSMTPEQVQAEFDILQEEIRSYRAREKERKDRIAAATTQVANLMDVEAVLDAPQVNYTIVQQNQTPQAQWIINNPFFNENYGNIF
jgi:hypothetical protein